MTVRSVLMTLICLFASATTLAAGQDVCACSPSTYEFTFDFDLTCPPPGNDNPEGIAEVTCFITSFSAEVRDLVPVVVRSISIIEADTGRIPIAQSQVDGNFVTGDSFTYASVSALGNSTQLPQSIQLTITGTNAENSSLVQVWAIKFTNDCNVYPVLEVDESYGWTKFTDLGTPRSEICPAASDNNIVSPETEPPTFKSTDAPTMAPTVETKSPTLKPTVPEVVTDAPTKSPKTPAPTLPKTDEPTMRPSGTSIADVPTAEESPSMKPTKAPKPGGKDSGTTLPPTSPPSILPNIEVTPKPTISLTLKPTIEGTLKPTLAVVQEETEAPSMEMSFSYAYLSEEEDLEWGREEEAKGEGDKVTKKAKDDEEERIRGKVRIGQRRAR